VTTENQLSVAFTNDAEGRFGFRDSRILKVFGKFSLGGRQFFKYNAAYLIDASDSRHSKTFRMQAEYEF
jgi:hypothetical protein